MITVEVVYTNKTIIKKFKNWKEACDYCFSDGDHCLDWKLINADKENDTTGNRTD